jgi:hypothetical protein
MKFDTNGNLQHWWSFPFTQAATWKPGELPWVHGIAVGVKGNLYLGNITSQRVQRFELVG